MVCKTKGICFLYFSKFEVVLYALGQPQFKGSKNG